MIKKQRDEMEDFFMLAGDEKTEKEVVGPTNWALGGP